MPLCTALAVIIIIEMFVPCAYLYPLLRHLKFSIFIPHKSYDAQGMREKQLREQA